ncbi:MAG: hypothetical protein CSA68_12265 [Rhodobacterales bacterium]|nr:MAG: hypothetical protein CSA68_12265 [Rhodobacterales bacterium]
MYRYLIALMIPLAGCATVHDQCVSRHAKEVRIIDDLIATTAGNIARGYAIEKHEQIEAGFVLCTGDDEHFGLCLSPQTHSKRTPVAIDVAAEKRKLAQLKLRRKKLKQGAEAQIAKCEARLSR